MKLLVAQLEDSQFEIAQWYIQIGLALPSLVDVLMQKILHIVGYMWVEIPQYLLIDGITLS